MKKFLRSVGFAIKGLKTAIGEQQNLKIQLKIALIAIALGFYFRINALEWCMLLFCMGLVISLELINTAIENLVNLITTEQNPLAGKIKDIGAAAVLVAAVVSAIIGIIIFAGYFLKMF